MPDSTCPYCGSTEDWYALEDGRDRCPNCYATSDAKGAEKAAKQQLEDSDSTDKATTTPSLIADDIASKAEAPPKDTSSGKNKGK